MLPHSRAPPYCTTLFSRQLWQLQSSKAPLGCVADISHFTAFQNLPEPLLKLLCPGDLAGKVIPSLHFKMYSSHSLFNTKTSSLISVPLIPALYKVWYVQVGFAKERGGRCCPCRHKALSREGKGPAHSSRR